MQIVICRCLQIQVFLHAASVEHERHDKKTYGQNKFHSSFSLLTLHRRFKGRGGTRSYLGLSL